MQGIYFITNKSLPNARAWNSYTKASKAHGFSSRDYNILQLLQNTVYSCVFLLFCVWVFLEMYLKHRITSPRARAEAAVCSSVRRADWELLHKALRGDESWVQLPGHGATASPQWRVRYPGYKIRVINLFFLPRDALCTCRGVKWHSKPNLLPEDSGT